MITLVLNRFGEGAHEFTQDDMTNLPCLAASQILGSAPAWRDWSPPEAPEEPALEPSPVFKRYDDFREVDHGRNQ